MRRSRETRASPAVGHSAVLAFLGMLLIAGNLRAAINAVGPVMPSIERSLGLSSASTSTLVSLPLLAFALVSPTAPWLAKRIGLERAAGMSLLMLAAGLLLRSSPTLIALWSGTALLGAAIAVLNVLLPALVKRDFPDRIGPVTGAYSAVQSVFAALAAGLAAPLAGASPLGWRLSLAVWSLLALLAFGLLAPRLTRQQSPEHGALPPLGSRSKPASLWRSALAWQVTIFMGLQSLIFYVYIAWLPSIEVSRGTSEMTAGFHLFVLSAAGIVGSLACPSLIGRGRDQRGLSLLISLGYLVGTAGLMWAPSLSLAWVCVTGFTGGASIVLALSLFGLRTRDHAATASLSGMAQSVGYLLAAFGPVLAGAIRDAAGTWVPSLVLLGIAEIALAWFGCLAGRNRHVDGLPHRATQPPPVTGGRTNRKSA